MIVVEPFQQEDFERCLEIRTKNYEEVNKTPEKIPGLRNYFLSIVQSRKLFVAKEGDLVIGMGGYNENHLSSFFVDPLYQGKGVGKLLLEKILSEVKSLGYTSANLNSSLYAKSFYERFGFVVVEEKNGGYHMEKQL